MTRNSFEERILKQYKNRLLSDAEIESICDQAVAEGILQKEDVKQITHCDTTELLLTINRWKSSYLYDKLKLDGSSDSEYETIKENQDNGNFEHENNSVFYTPSKQTERSFIDPIYNSPINQNLVRGRELDNPFSPSFKSPFNRKTQKDGSLEFESFCEDLKEKTKSIKKIANDRTTERVKKLIDDFIKYTEGNKVDKQANGYRRIFVIMFLLLFLFCLYTPKPI